jgi:hypothetical protein
MKKLTVTLCVCLALAAVPLQSQAADHPRAEKAGSVLSSALVGAGAGLLIGTIYAAFAQSTTGYALGTGVAVGAGLGALFAIMNPEPADADQPPVAAQPEQGKDVVYPPGTKAARPSLLNPTAPDDAQPAQ